MENLADLSAEDREAIEQLVCEWADFRAGDDLVREGERPNHVHLLLEGWAFRYKLLLDGGRQIIGFLIPGDICDAQVFILKRMDHSIGLLSDAKVALIPEQQMVDLLDQHPRIARAIAWATLVDEATLREWLVNMGQRDPYERLAHLLSELHLRMQSIGLADEGRLALPLTQNEIGDTLGLTPVTINRMLQRLRSEGLIELRRGCLTVLDVGRLRNVSDFNANYLHLDRIAGRRR